MRTDYFLGQGRVLVAARNAAGEALAQRWLGDVSDLKISFKTDTIRNKENYSGQRGTVKNLIIGKEATVDLTLEELSQDNLALALYGKPTKIDSGSISGEALPIGLLAGDTVSLNYMKVSNVVITDSASTPVTLDASKYDINAEYGSITFKDVASAQQPFKVAYTHAALDNVSVFTSAQPEVFLRYEGINLAENNAPIVVELYKVSTEPLKELALITDQLTNLAITASALIDNTKPASDEFGQFGRILQVA